jgi:hypothetical protein
MRISCLATMMSLATIALLGCGGDSAQGGAFELQGNWVYLGPGDGPHDLKISGASMVYTDEAGKWSSNWTIKSYDNSAHHFEIVFDSGTGTYLPVGDKMSGAYVLDGLILTVQLASGLGSYPQVKSPGSCTEGTSTLIPDCRIYMKQ